MIAGKNIAQENIAEIAEQAKVLPRPEFG